MPWSMRNALSGDGVGSESQGDDLAQVGDASAAAGAIYEAWASEPTGLDQVWEQRPGTIRIELPVVNDRSAEHRPVACEELARRVHHDVGAVLDRTQQVRRREGVVDDQRDAVLVSNRSDRGNIEDVVLGVGDRFGEQQPGRRANRALPRGRVIRVIHERRLDAEPRDVVGQEAARSLVDARC